MTDLGTLTGPTGTSHGQAASADGSIVVGYGKTPTNLDHATRWIGSSILDLGSLDGNIYNSYAKGVSDDGTVIIGFSFISTGAYRAVRWTAGTGMVALGTLGGDSSEGRGVSADGTVIVGVSTLASGDQHAFRWTGNTMTDLGTLGGTRSSASATSADGSVVVGNASDASGTTSAYIWNAPSGIRSIQTLLTDSGVNMAGWQLTNALSVSADGTVIVGIGASPTFGNPQAAWIARCTANCSILSVDNAGQSFSGLGGLGATGSAYLGSQFDAAGDMAEAGKTNPITGFASGAFDSDPTTSASVGATYSFGNDLIAGATVGVAGIQTLMPFNGSATFNGPSATMFVASKPDSGANFLVGGSLVGLSGTITRGYLNGNTPVTSTGSTTGTAAGFTAQAGWTFKDLVANTLVTPFVGLTVSSLSYAAYTETGGPFPASFSAFSTTSAVARIGVEGRYEFRKQSYLDASVSYGHDFGSGGSIAGTIPGVLTLSVLGAAPARDFIEAGVGLDMPIRNTIRVSAHLGALIPFTGSASLQARAGFSMAF